MSNPTPNLRIPNLPGDGMTADVLLTTLLECGAEYLFVNLGTDHTSIIEAVARFDEHGWARPKVILCPHETVALSMAHGYGLLKGRAQAVLVHVDVGTQHLGGAVHNIARSRVPVVIIAGLAPVTDSPDVPGSRDMFVHYIQDMSDQASIVRPYMKWELELRHPASFQASIERAFQVANAAPTGPVYMSVTREILESEAWVPEARRPIVHSQADPVLDEASVDTIARWLSDAEFPVAITSYAGRRSEAVKGLVELAEMLGMAVMEAAPHCMMNFPTDHPQFAGPRDVELLRQADCILILDCDVPWLGAREKPDLRARIVHLDVDPIKAQLPLWTFPTDLSAAVEVSKALPQINRRLSQILAGKNPRPIDDRRQRVTRIVAEKRAGWQASLVRPEAGQPMTAEWLTARLNALIPQEAIIIEELVSNAAIGARYLTRSRPGTHFASGGSGIGWGLAAAAGAKLAAPEAEVVCLLGDGAFLFAPPSAALWVARQYDAAALYVIYNNRGWSAPEKATRLQHPDGFAANRRQFSASFGEGPDHARTAAAAGCYAERVSDADALDAAFERAREAVGRGMPAVLDVLITPVTGSSPL